MNSKIVAQNPESSILLKLAMIICGGLILFLVSITLISGGYQLFYSGRILPGISVAGIDVSGLYPAEASLKLSQKMMFPSTGKILFRDGEKYWLASPAELGLIFNAGTSVQAAYQAGRSGGIFKGLNSQIKSWQEGLDLPPVIIFDERVAYAYLQKIAGEIDKPVIEANLALNGIQVIAVNGQAGRLLNVDSTMTLLTNQLRSFSDGEVQLVIDVVTPSILDVTSQADLLRNLMGSPITLSVPNMQVGDPGPWIIEPSALANMLRIEQINDGATGQYSIGFYESGFKPILDEISTKIQRKSQNARFIFNDQTKILDLFQPAVTGRTLNTEATLKTIQDQALLGNQNITIEVNLESPQVGDDATAQSLGITELVSMESTYFYGSSPERVQNIKTASSRFKGLLVAPGETFSMSDALGDVSLENGYSEALIIYDNRTIKGVGGGVCQVSTTLFRTVFFGGFPIVERHPHAYRVGYYEQTSSGAHDTKMAGLDATVYVPLVDFKFTNDSPYWLLMETYVYNNNQLTWKFYSTNEGRSVTWTTSGLQNVIKAPEALFEENPDLGPFELNQIDYAADGAMITINRTVYKNGEVYFVDLPLVTVYSPWQAICEYGSGVEDPKAKAALEHKCQAP
jgi:vancomycin resistance protein YoaR